MINLKNKILIFDLDDTLYDSRSFTFQGFYNVSVYLSKKLKIKHNLIYSKIISLYKLNKHKTFNRLLEYYNLKKKYLIVLIKIYRYSKKKLKLYDDAFFLLNHIEKKRLFLITDGNKLMQKKKIKYLRIKKYFKKIFITNQYGAKYNKPSAYCFKKIKNFTNSRMNQLVYIGDNPKKDFIIKKMV